MSIASDLQNIWTKLSRWPDRFTPGGNIARMARAAKKFATVLLGIFDALGGYLRALEKDVGKFDSKGFKNDLNVFFKYLGDIPGTAARKLGIPVPKPPQDLVARFINPMPAILLYPLAEVLEQLPGWAKMPQKIKGFLDTIPDLAYPLDQAKYSDEKVYVEIYVARSLTRSLKAVLAAVKEAAPKDLSVDVDILGEGGGTEVSGHPVKFPFVTAILILDLADQAFTAYLDLSAHVKSAA